MENALPGLQSLIETVRRLRDPQGGCPWDRAQTHHTLKPYALEEVHEFLESLDRKGADAPETWEELGDVLFQVVLHSQLLSERGLTTLDGIAAQTSAKLVERHPHVFDPKAERFQTPEEVNRAWERLKAQRKAGQPPASRASRVSNVPRSLPSLQQASRVGEKAASLGFDWARAEDVLPKLHEELAELEADQGDEKRAQEELGDLLFAAAQYARKRKWDPEACLSTAVRKFLGRFETMEELILREGQDWDRLGLEGLERYWQAAKRHSPSKDS